MRIACITAGLAIFPFYTEKAFAWAQEGHAAIAAIAQNLISPTTQAKVQELLAKGGDQDLISVASWADQVIIAAHDEGPLRGNQEALEFNQKFPKSAMWHFVNLPLGATSYAQVAIGAGIFCSMARMRLNNCTHYGTGCLLSE